MTSALLTDLYRLNMIQAYVDHGQTKIAVFEFFVRKCPARRGFLVAAGLEDVRYDAEGRMTGDTLAVEGEDQPGEPLIEPVMRNGPCYL